MSSVSSSTKLEIAAGVGKRKNGGFWTVDVLLSEDGKPSTCVTFGKIFPPDTEGGIPPAPKPTRTLSRKFESAELAEKFVKDEKEAKLSEGYVLISETSEIPQDTTTTTKSTKKKSKKEAEQHREEEEEGEECEGEHPDHENCEHSPAAAPSPPAPAAEDLLRESPKKGGGKKGAKDSGKKKGK